MASRFATDFAQSVANFEQLSIVKQFPRSISRRADLICSSNSLWNDDIAS